MSGARDLMINAKRYGAYLELTNKANYQELATVETRRA
jgi:hypothetical protein